MTPAAEKKFMRQLTRRLIKRLDKAALTTKSGKARNLLVDASIVLDIYANGGLNKVVTRIINENDVIEDEMK